MYINFKVDEIFHILQFNTINNNILYYTIDFIVKK